MHEISELVQFAAPVASVGGLAAIARLASARESRRRSRAISPGAPEIDRVEDEMDGGEDLAAISTIAGYETEEHVSPANLEEGTD